jgi:hypothetical protein
MAKVIARLTADQQRRALRAFTDMRIATEHLAEEESRTNTPTGDVA